jgi:MFS family permease
MPTPHASSLRYGWYVVAVCTAAYLLSFVDRQILSLLVGPIKADLGISDTAFALLHGLPLRFSATLGVPLAGLADRASRPAVIAGGIAVWSLATAACGLAGSFGALLAARVMVGAGEAALSPAAYALINDLFPREKLGRAIGVYSLGSFFGAGLAFLAGGAVIAAVSGQGRWRWGRGICGCGRPALWWGCPAWRWRGWWRSPSANRGTMQARGRPR